MVTRAVCQILSPGLISTSVKDETANSKLCSSIGTRTSLLSICEDDQHNYGVTLVDATTGRLQVGSFHDASPQKSALRTLLIQESPAEVVYNVASMTQESLSVVHFDCPEHGSNAVMHTRVTGDIPDVDWDSKLARYYWTENKLAFADALGKGMPASIFRCYLLLSVFPCYLILCVGYCHNNNNYH